MGDEASDGGWKTVTRRKTTRYGRENNNETSIFISNIPEDCTNAILWKIFKSFRRLVDAYIPNKKNKGGKKFGFIKFLSVKDQKFLVDNIKAVKIDGMPIEANVSLYPKRSQMGRQNTHERGPAYVPKQRVNAGRYNNGGREYNPNTYGDNHKQANHNTFNGKSFKDVLSGTSYKTMGDKRKVAIIPPKVSEFSKICQKKALIETELAEERTEDHGTTSSQPRRSDRGNQQQ